MHPEEARKLFFSEVDNCYWNPKLTINVLPNGDRTVVTSTSLQKEEPLVVLNKDASFSVEKCFQFSKENIAKLPRPLIIPAYLYQFYTKHTTEFPVGYNHYFDALPTYEWYAENHELLKLYLKLSEEQRLGLKENFFLFDQINSIVKWASEIPGHKVNKEEAIRSVLASSTRSWSSVGLVPWIDFFNHDYDGSFLRTEGTTIVASHEYEKNEEVNTSYGLKDSLQLLTVYGYVTRDKTVGIKFPNISEFALASAPELKNYQEFSLSTLFLFGHKLKNFDYFIAHMRLSVFNKWDAINISDLAEEHKTFISGRNELDALKLALHLVKKTRSDLDSIKSKIHSVIKKMPQVLDQDFKGKDEVLDLMEKRIYKYWLDLLDKE